MTTCLKTCMTLWVKVLHIKPPSCQFGCQRTCDSRDITDLIFHVTMQDRVIKGLCDFMEGDSSFYIYTLSSLVAIGVVLTDI